MLTCPGIVEDLKTEIRRLERLLETERICHKQTKAKLAKAEHDRDRYYARLKEYQDLRKRIANLEYLEAAGINIAACGLVPDVQKMMGLSRFGFADKED